MARHCALGINDSAGISIGKFGETALLAQALLNQTQGKPNWIVLTILIIVTMTLSDVLNNTAATIVAAPVALHLAEQLEVSPDPFLIAVAIAESAAFLTPIGHKNNTIILRPRDITFLITGAWDFLWKL